jgi:dihydrofolate synthase/folylpolyglutamate synthase
VVTVPIHQDNAMAPEALAEAVRRIGIPAEPRESVVNALAAIGRRNLDPPPRILITGSLYLAGEVLALNDTAPR